MYLELVIFNYLFFQRTVKIYSSSSKQKNHYMVGVLNF